MAVADYSIAEDVEIVGTIAAGQQAALATLYDRYHRPCFAFAVRMLASEEDAREAVQEAFVRVWRSAAAYERERASVAGWVLSITRNLCIDELRRRRRRVPELPSLEGAMDRPGADRTDLDAERIIIGEQVRAALRSLSSEQRSAIELVYFQGLTSQEAGRILNIPAPTVRSRLRLGLLKLGGILQEQGLAATD